MSTKIELRDHFLRILKRQSKSQVLKRSRKIHQKLFSLEQFEKASVVACYASLPEEVDTQAILHRVLSEKKEILLPVMDGKKKKLIFYKIRDLKKDLRLGVYGILEPDPAKTRRVKAAEIECVLVPGVAFDRQGYRLGRGGGYYDRFLKTVRARTTKVGLGFSFQAVDHIPKNKHDVRLDIILTD